MKKKLFFVLLIVLFIVLYFYKEPIINYINTNVVKTSYAYSDNEIIEYKDSSYIELNDNKPLFKEEDYTLNSFEKYSDLDYLGRCGVAFANISIHVMPKEERKSISSVTPTGWQTVKYDNISGKYLYNRCHLIGFQLSGENANKKNLITCTRQMNTEDMLNFENKVALYVKENNKHVLYRVTPVFENDNLVASGVQIEASSVEDKCTDICFNVYIYNVQDGIKIDYKTGESILAN